MRSRQLWRLCSSLRGGRVRNKHNSADRTSMQHVHRTAALEHAFASILGVFRCSVAQIAPCMVSPCRMMHIMTMPQDETPLQHVNKPGLCPDGSRPVQCLADPCKTNNRCNNATQVCQSNYCGGCNAVCKPKPKPTAGQCPDGSSFVNCLKDPCASNGPCSKDEKCLSNYCGGCNATCIKNTTNSPPNTQHQPKPADGQCAKGVEVVQCLADPCKVNNPCNPQTETCEANYCGSCSAVCRTNGKKNGTGESTSAFDPQLVCSHLQQAVVGATVFA